MTLSLGQRGGGHSLWMAAPLLWSALAWAGAPPRALDVGVEAERTDEIALRARISELSASLAECRSDKAHAELRLESLQAQLKGLRAEIEALASKLQEAVREGTRKAEESEALRASAASLQKAAAEGREARAALAKELAAARAIAEAVPALRKDLEERTRQLAEANRELSVVRAERQEVRDRAARLSRDLEATRNEAAEKIEEARAEARRGLARQRLWIVLELVLILALGGTLAKLRLDRRARGRSSEAEPASIASGDDLLWQRIPVGRADPRDAAPQCPLSCEEPSLSSPSLPPPEEAVPAAPSDRPGAREGSPPEGGDDLVAAFRSLVERRFDRIVRKA